MENYSDEIDQLKSILNKTELTETKKWGIPVYTYNGKNVVGIAGFKEHFTLWFYNGVFLKDEKRKLISGGEDTKALRQWRFSQVDEIDEPLILQYVQEAIRNEELGKRWKPQKSEIPEIPTLMAECFSKEPALQTEFSKLTPYKQKEYIEHISAAKREATQISRMEKIKPMIMEGKGLYDKYK
ncbi:MAG TPA: DUF1801 domain-containing protein [Salinimicrobium sp.]|nr:DUF1801 domain-containing protein [Salinimicrobium sp.]